MVNPGHVPVMVDEVLQYLQPHAGGLYVDATVGLGGHTAAILERCAPDGRAIAIDQDPVALEAASARLSAEQHRLTFRHATFADLGAVLDDLDVTRVDGVLMDLGVSSLQLEDPERGFSFLRDGPLDMRMNPETNMTAADVVNRWRPDVLERALGDFGEERWARRIARAIVHERRHEPFASTRQLVETIERNVPRTGARGASRIHPATRTFQALRIVVNAELDQLRSGVDVALSSISTEGTVAVIAFHSLEDRIVKRSFRDAAKAATTSSADGRRFEILTRRPIRPTEDEVHNNPRARSAKLRAIRRTL